MGNKWILDIGVKLNEGQIVDLKKQVDNIVKAKKEIVIGINTGDAKAVTTAFANYEKSMNSVQNSLQLTNKGMTQFNTSMKESVSLTKKVENGYASIERKLSILQQKNEKAFGQGKFSGQLGNLQGLMGEYQGASGDLAKQNEILQRMKNSYTELNTSIKQSVTLTKKVEDGYASIERKLSVLQQKNEKAFGAGKFSGQLGNIQGLMGEYQGASGNLTKQNEILQRMKNSYTELNNAVSIYNQTEKTFGGQILYNSKRFLQYTAAARGFFLVVSGAQKMVDNVKDLDKSLVEVQKVTNLAGRELEVFTQKAFEAGSEVARTGKEIIDAAAVFARSGYTIKESLDLATESAVLLNVADNMTSIEEAAQTLISTLKAYNLETVDARRVTDIFNEVSNNSAISFDDLTEAIKRSGAIFAQSNTSIEEFSALITGANEIIQNVEKSSTGLNTISLRLRG